VTRHPFKGISMGLRLSGSKGETCFFVTTTFLEHQPYGNMEGMYDALLDSLIFYCNKYKAGLFGYVFMPTHIHLLIRIDGEKLSAFMRDFKKYISQKAARNLGLNMSHIWAPRYHKIVIFSEDIFYTKLKYMHNNPVKSGLVCNPEDWENSSARHYLRGTKDGLSEIMENY